METKTPLTVEQFVGRCFTRLQGRHFDYFSYSIDSEILDLQYHMPERDTEIYMANTRYFGGEIGEIDARVRHKLDRIGIPYSNKDSEGTPMTVGRFVMACFRMISARSWLSLSYQVDKAGGFVQLSFELEHGGSNKYIAPLELFTGTADEIEEKLANILDIYQEEAQ